MVPIDVTVSGARGGDLASASLVSSTRFIELDAAVWSNNTVRVMARNISAATFDLAAATLSVGWLSGECREGGVWCGGRSVFVGHDHATPNHHHLAFSKRSPGVERQWDAGEQCYRLEMADLDTRCREGVGVDGAFPVQDMQAGRSGASVSLQTAVPMGE